ncbi:MAG: hypothetical protein KGH79_00515 [Patescibacteria group bacterium]|nr:hypothetical protein [Patescibacteria group bacterium]
MLQPLLKPGSNQSGTGSTMIAFDFSECDEIINHPAQLRDAIRAIITRQGLTPRENDFTDTWGSREEGPSTIFIPLKESHIRLWIFSGIINRLLRLLLGMLAFFRIETWPDRKNHVNGEVQICNYSRNNRMATAEIVVALAQLLKPKLISLHIFQRGPDEVMRSLRTLHAPAERLLRELKFLENLENVEAVA